MNTNVSELQHAANRIEEQKRKELADLATTLHQGLVLDVSNTIIPEIVFKEFFLEHFYKLMQVNSTVDVGSPLTLKWIELAGGPYNKVDVLDSNGKTLFTVPSLFLKPKLDETVIKNMNFNSIAGTYEARSNRIHTDGINYLSRELSAIHNSISTINNNEKEVWVGIFARYYRPQTKTAPTTIAIKDTSAEYDFD